MTKLRIISPSLVKGLGLFLTTVLVIFIGGTNPVPLPPKTRILNLVAFKYVE